MLTMQVKVMTNYLLFYGGIGWLNYKLSKKGGMENALLICSNTDRQLFQFVNKNEWENGMTSITLMKKLILQQH